MGWLKKLLKKLFGRRKPERSAALPVSNSDPGGIAIPAGVGSSIPVPEIPAAAEDEITSTLSVANNSNALVPHSTYDGSDAVGPSIPKPKLGKPLPAEFGLGVLAEGVDTDVDIVAIHGLNGHRERTWTAKNGVLWLRDLLPLKLPSARIITYGYDARTHSSEPVATQVLFELGQDLLGRLSLCRRKTKTTKRPIIFVVHSLGGIVLKSALIQSDATRKENLEKLKDIKLSTYGILFFGTPHLGTDDVGWAEILLNIASIKFNINKNILQHLKRDSEVLRQQISSYTQISGDFDTRFFCEKYPTPIMSGKKTMIVPPKYAIIPGMPNAEVYYLSKHHQSMVVFEGDEDGFENVFPVLLEMTEGCSERIKKNWEEWDKIKAIGEGGRKVYYEIPMQLPYHRNDKFVGRTEELSRIHEAFRGSGSSSGSLRVEILHGTGGMGKTQIALEYAYRFGADYSAIFWVNGASLQATIQSFYAIAQYIFNHHISTQQSPTPNYQLIAHEVGMTGLIGSSGPSKGKVSSEPDDEDRVVNAVMSWFSNKENSRWLLIFDNVDDIQGFDISKFFPPSSNGGCAIITSRRPDYHGQSMLAIEKLDEESAVRLLLNIGGGVVIQDQDRTEATKIVNKLGLMPLAIAQAGAYIRKRGIPFDRYLPMYDENFKHLASKIPLGGGKSGWQYGERSVFTTWEISFKAVEKEDPAAAEILLLCSFMSNEDIKEWVFVDEACTESEVEDRVDKLFSYSLAKRMESPVASQGTSLLGFSVHPVVHTWARERQTTLQKTRRVKSVVILLGKMFERSTPQNVHEIERFLLPHMDASIKNRDRVLKSLVESSINEYTNSLYIFAGIYDHRGMHKKSEKLRLEELRISTEALGKDHPGTLTSMGNLASTYWNQGQLDKAEKLQVEVLEARKRVLGEDHPDTLISMSNLASTYSGQGQLDRAEKLKVEVLEVRKRVLGEDHPSTLTSMNNLASTYSDQGQLDRAEKLEVEVLEAMKRVLGEDHPNTLISMSNLASTYSDQGQLDRAEKLQVEVLEARKRVLGEDHPDTLTSMSNLASTYSDQGQLDRAEKLKVEVLEARKRVLGEDHPDTLTSMGNLASTYWNQGQLDKAEKLEMEVLEAMKRVLGEDHPDTLISMSNLASTYSDQGQLDRAEKLQVEVLEARKRVLGEDHPDTLISMSNLASTYSDQGQLDRAEKLEVEVLEARKRVLGEDHPDTLISMNNLASTYSDQGQLDKAEKLEAEVLEAMKRVLGEDHPNTLTSMSNLALTYSDQGQLDRAEKLQVEVLEASKRVLSEGHPGTLTSMSNLALIHRKKGQFEMAEKLETELQTLRQTAGIKVM